MGRAVDSNERRGEMSKWAKITRSYGNSTGRRFAVVEFADGDRAV
jgi:hypothetical protein